MPIHRKENHDGTRYQHPDPCAGDAAAGHQAAAVGAGQKNVKITDFFKTPAK